MSEGVLHEFVRVLHSCIGGQSGFELCLEIRIVENAQRASGNVIDYSLFHSQEEGLALINQYLRYILIHDDGTLNRVFGQVLNRNCLIQFTLYCSLSSRHLVGLDLVHTVLSSKITTETNQMIDFLLEFSSGAFLEVLDCHVVNHLNGSIEVLGKQLFSDLRAVVLLFSHFFRDLLHQTGLHVDQLVLEGNVAFSSHVDRNYQLLDQVVLGLEVSQSNLLNGVDHLIVLSCVLYLSLQRVVSFLAVDNTLAKASEGTSYRKVGFAITSDNVADGLVKFIVRVVLESLFKNGITLLYAVVPDLSIGHQNDVDELTINDSGGNCFGGCSSSVPSLLNNFVLKLFLG